MTSAPAPAPRLRPLGAGELLDAAIKVCLRNAGTLIKSVLVVALPVRILSAIILASTVSDPTLLEPFSSHPQTVRSGSDFATYFGGQAGTQVLGVVSFLLATGACFHAIAQAWLGRPPGWRESLRFATRRALPLLWISILLGLGVMVGLVLCFIPGIYLGVVWALAFPVLFVEDKRGTKALGRSQALVSGRFWPTLGVLALSFVLAGIFQTVVSVLVLIGAAFNDSLAFLIVLTSFSALIGTLVATPFQAAVVALVYFDQRVRNEGLDLELLAARLGGGDPMAVAAAGAPAMAYAQPDQYTPEQRAQAPFWPPPPGWQPSPSAPAGPEVPPGASNGGGAPPGWLPPTAEPEADRP